MRLKAKGWTAADVIEFKTNIDEKLKRIGIAIEMTEVDLECFTPGKPHLADSIIREKPNQASFNRNHDLAALERVQAMRVSQVRRVAESPAFLLTADHALYRFDQRESRHGVNGTIGVAMLDYVFASLLWLKDPRVDLSIEALVTAHAGDLLINKRVWKQFHTVLARLKDEGRLEESALAALLYQSYLSNVLKDFDESALPEIDDDFVLEHAEIAAREMEASVRESRELADAERRRGEAEREATERSERERAKNTIKQIEQQADERERQYLAERDRIAREAETRGYNRALQEQAGREKQLFDRARAFGNRRAKVWTRVLRVYLFIVGLVGGGFSWWNGVLDVDKLATLLTLGIALVAFTIQPFIVNMWKGLETALAHQIGIQRLRQLRRASDLLAISKSS